ncbi:MAG: hypothetical protein K8R74_10300, partial [Bacteroidales bacterium]|nr:hypothetical protein [Bacteroidales bacterium]
GEIDPWTAGAVELTGASNALKIIQPGANHSILLAGLDQKELVYSKLEEWLDVTVQEGGNSLSKNSHYREEILPIRRFNN